MHNVKSGNNQSIINIKRTVLIVSAYVVKNKIKTDDISRLIEVVYSVFDNFDCPTATPAGYEIEKPSLDQIRKSITPDALISFVDGKPYKTLKRHLARNGLDFDAYRARYGLPGDYPTTSATYSAARAAIARNIGFGREVNRSSRVAVDEAVPDHATVQVPRRRGRPRKAV